MKIIALALLITLFSSSCSPLAPHSKSALVNIENKRYRVVAEEVGQMSWYSVKTNFGTATASGEEFTNHGHTAAHKKLKMGTMVRITNLENGKSRVARINDRGPFKPGRIIDVAVGLSHGNHLDFHHRGVTDCKVEVLEPIGPN